MTHMLMQKIDSQMESFAQQIEHELLNGLATFPTVFDISLRIKQLADDPDVSLAQIAEVVQTEPLLCAKTVRMANLMAFNPYQHEIKGVKDAIGRIGLSTLRCLAFAVAAEQLARDHRSAHMRQIANGLWMHSVDIAAWSCTLASHFKRRDVDSAMLAGMMLNIGQFYMLARAANHPGVESDIRVFSQVVMTWDEAVRSAVLEAFEMPQSIIEACAFSSLDKNGVSRSELGEIVRLAACHARTPSPFASLSGVDAEEARDKTCRNDRIDPGVLHELELAAREARHALMDAAFG